MILYYVEYGDTLSIIANKFQTTVQKILEANVICNPNLIFIGQPLIIPQEDEDIIYKAGGRPYYVILNGDSLWCLARQFNTSIETLKNANNIDEADIIYPGDELLIAPDIPDPEQLYENWKSTGDMYCNMMNPLMVHGTYYIGSFMWEAVGDDAIPYLIKLLSHPCEVVRYYAVMSLGRLARNNQVQQILINVLLKDLSPSVSDIASIALRRIELVKKYGRRIHVMTTANWVYGEPNLNTQIFVVPRNETIRVLRWSIPSPTGEEGPRGDLQLYDQIQVLRTGQIGFIPRVGYNEITML